MKRKLLTMVLSVAMVISICSISAVVSYAAVPQKSVTLTVNDKWVESEDIYYTAARAEVYNASSSKHRVYGIIKYKSGSNYINDRQFLVSPGDTGSGSSKSSFLSSKYWRIQLNPYGAGTKKCTANGTIYGR